MRLTQQNHTRSSPTEQKREDGEHREGFLRLVHGFDRRPEPRGLFDRIACGRAKPWIHYLVPIRVAVLAGQTKENAKAPVRALDRAVEGMYDDDGQLADPVLILAGEAIREAELREPKVRALVSLNPADLEAAADALEREALADLEDARRLRAYARLRRSHKRTRTLNTAPAARVTGSGTVMEAVR